MPRLGKNVGVSTRYLNNTSINQTADNSTGINFRDIENDGTNTNLSVDLSQIMIKGKSRNALQSKTY